ncbi:hypothetical protein [Aureibacter tunicatorum]|uniref:Uncharacterized protein n=1 Tax=Aureibacter tunicatorum TaxID=866807 RepID=A0AAE3XS82_9BACT|nr:hypothetical protein [Aureibacter tunicatorum]MDR6240946.1 hypothetical protein [Aureibacter tunicatorum]BDD03726.1 hypothetical protein AUTU_12090 [Aureibacter tunicatorum]
MNKELVYMSYKDLPKKEKGKVVERFVKRFELGEWSFYRNLRNKSFKPIQLAFINKIIRELTSI